MSAFQNDPNNPNNNDGGGDDNDHNNRDSHPKAGENHEDDEEVSADCSQYNQNITMNLLNGILARNGASNIFSSPHPVASNPEDQRRLLTSILQDAVRICSDDDFLPSGNYASAYSRRASSSSSNPDDKPNKRSDLQ